MSDLRKAAQQALQLMRQTNPLGQFVPVFIIEASKILKAALAQPEQEPVAWRYDEATYRPDDLRGRQWHFNLFSTHKPYADNMVQNVTPLYTAPPQRLIAAAPELLAAVKKFVAWSKEENHNTGSTFWERVEMLRDLDAAASAATAKAEGEE